MSEENANKDEKKPEAKVEGLNIGLIVLAAIGVPLAVAGISLAIADASKNSTTTTTTSTSSESSSVRSGAKEERLEKKLSAVDALTACELYGKRNYQDFSIHMAFGRIAEESYDEDTWYMKYSVDYNGYENRAMECYVTGTSENPVVSKFLVY